MFKSLIKGLVLVAVVGVKFPLCEARTVYAGNGFGPGIEGVSFAEIGQWQSRYGGGTLNGCDFLPALLRAGLFAPGGYAKPPSPCRVPKTKRAKSRK